MSLPDRVSFNTLPNELLEIICSYADGWSVFPRKKGNIYRVLSRTNRRLRAFALPFSFAKASFSNVGKLWNYVQFLEELGYPDAIRYLKLQQKGANRHPLLPDFPRLRTVVYVDKPLDMRFLIRDFGSCSLLQHLYMAWTDTRIPDIQTLFPRLQTLYLILYKAIHAESPISAPNITSLFITNYRLSAEICGSFDSCFPNLCVLSLHNTAVVAIEVLSIIRALPSLSEVTYRQSSFTEEIFLLGHLLDVVLAEESNPVEDAFEPSAHWPSRYTWRDIKVHDFAFVRKQFVVESVRGSIARFEVTSLSLEQRDFDSREDNGKDDLIEILSEFPFRSGLTEIEELCLEVIVFPRTTAKAYGEYMETIARNLRYWPCLQRFAFSADLEPFYAWSNHVAKPVPVLDSIMPPAFDDLLIVGDVQEMLDDFVEDIAGYQDFEFELRSKYLGPTDVGNGARLDPFIEVMPIWEARHEPEVAMGVNRLARCCPSLKEFVWYVGSVSWHWKIQRRKGSLGRFDNVRVFGSLYWPESTRPFFPSFQQYSMVGEERRNMENREWSRSAF